MGPPARGGPVIYSFHNTRSYMDQIRHTNPKVWPLPMGRGLLVEVDFGKVKTTHIELLDGGFRNLATASIRAVSPALPDEIKNEMLPGGTGSVGARVIVSEPNLRFLEVAEYKACGFEEPEPDKNGKGDLAFISYERIIGVMHETPDTDAKLPFRPLGARIFFEYDFDDESDEIVEQASGLILREKDIAADNQMATVIGTGPLSEFLQEGDRIIVKRFSNSVNYQGKKYYFAANEHEIFAVLEKEEEA